MLSGSSVVSVIGVLLFSLSPLRIFSSSPPCLFRMDRLLNDEIDTLVNNLIIFLSLFVWHWEPVCLIQVPGIRHHQLRLVSIRLPLSGILQSAPEWFHSPYEGTSQFALQNYSGKHDQKRLRPSFVWLASNHLLLWLTFGHS